MKLFSSIVCGLEGVLALAFPSVCVTCHESVEDSLYPSVCRRCATLLQFIDNPKCLTCGFPIFGVAESVTHCMHCEHLQPAFGQGWSLTLFRGPARDLVHALKYESGFWALRDLKVIMKRAPGLAEFAEDACFVPVPLHGRKQRERGYNQSELIVAELARVLPATRRANLLQRLVDTPSQTQFNRRERVRNLKNAFALRSKHGIDPKLRYIVVDDVFTTGSTLNACAAALRRGGARRVDVMTVCHG